MIGRSVDSLLRGDAVGAAELLLQRLKAIETAHHDKSWDVARHLVPLPPAQVTALSRQERASLARDEKQALALTRPSRSPSPRAGPSQPGHGPI